MSLSAFARHYLLALQFFTRIPVSGRLARWVGFTPAMLRASAAHFPGVGWLVGALAAAVYAAATLALPGTPYTPLAAAVLCSVASALLTGGLHEDGLADVADGLGGGAERARALALMKDSRIGAFGALALTLALLSKTALLAVLGGAGPQLACLALLGGHVLSRGLSLLLSHALPYLGEDASSKSKLLAGQLTPTALLTAFLWCFSALVYVTWASDALFFIAGTASAGLALLWIGRLFARRLQGVTGDALGAAQQVCEIAFYLGAAIAVA